MKQNKGAFPKRALLRALDEAGYTLIRDFKRQVWRVSTGEEFKSLQEVQRWFYEKHTKVKRLDPAAEVQAPVA